MLQKNAHVCRVSAAVQCDKMGWGLSSAMKARLSLKMKEMTLVSGFAALSGINRQVLFTASCASIRTPQLVYTTAHSLMYFKGVGRGVRGVHKNPPKRPYKA